MKQKTSTMASGRCYELHRCCTVHDLVGTKRCISSNADVNKKYLDDNTSLHCALMHSNPSRQGRMDQAAIVQALLQAGANVNTPGNNGLSPLHLACRLKAINIIGLLIDKGADLNAMDPNMESPFHMVFKNPGYTVSENEVVKYPDRRVSHQAENLDSEERNQEENWNLEAILILLLDSGVLVNVPGYNGATHLHLACARKDELTMNLLIAKKADVNAADDNGDRPLHMALRRPYTAAEHGKMVVDLIKMGANIHSAGNKRSRPLHLACDVKDLFVIKHLVYSGADIDPKNADIDTPLHLALNASYMREHHDIVSYLLAAGADVHAVGAGGNTALHLASNWADKTLMQTLLQEGAVSNATNDLGSTPLHLAVKCMYGKDTSDRADAALVLLEAGADISAGDGLNLTPLHFACLQGEVEAIQMLMAFGADPHAVSDLGETPIFYALDNESAVKIIHILCKAGADVNCKDNSGKTCLMKAFKTSDETYRLEIVKALFQYGADGAELHSKNRSGHVFQSPDLFYTVCKSGFISDLCKLGVVLPPDLHNFFAQSINTKPRRREELRIVVVMCQAGLDITEDIHELAFGLLPSQDRFSRWFRNPFFSMYLQFTRAVSPHSTSLKNQMMIGGWDYLKALLADLNNLYKSPASLKTLAIYNIRKWLCKVGRRRSILPRIGGLGLPPAVCSEVRLTLQTENLLAEI